MASSTKMSKVAGIDGGPVILLSAKDSGSNDLWAQFRTRRAFRTPNAGLDKLHDAQHVEHWAGGAAEAVLCRPTL